MDDENRPVNENDGSDRTDDEQSVKINEFRRRQQSVKSKKIAKRVIVVLVICCLLLAVWMLRKQILSQNLYESIQTQIADMSAGDGFPKTIKGNNAKKENFAVSGKNIALLSDTDLSVFTPSGNVLAQSQHKFASPVLKTSNLRWLMYDAGGKKYDIESVSGNVLEGTTDNDIVTGAITDNGKFAIITFSDKYMSKLSVYMEDGSLQYTYSFSSCYITSFDLDESGKYGVACGTYSDGGKLSSVVYMFDFDNPDPLSVYHFEDVMFLTAQYSGGNAVCIGDNIIAVIDGKTLESKVSKITGDTVSSWGIYNGYFVTSSKTYAGAEESTIKVCNKDCEEICSIKQNDEVRDVDIFGDTFVILTNNATYAYDVTTGNLIGKYDTGTDSVNIKLSSADTAYILSLSEIRKIKIG